MKVAFSLLAVLLAACAQDNRAVMEKLKSIEEKLDKVAAQPGARGGAAAGAMPQRPPGPDPTKAYAVPVGSSPVVGPADAKVTIVKAYEYACPFCERVRPTMDELTKKYGNDIRIVSRQYVVHPQKATSTALAACAASKQGKFKDMDFAMWENIFKVQKFDGADCWKSGDGCTNLNEQAKKVGLNVDKFKEDMKSCEPMIQQDQRELAAFGVSGTPAFFVNGRFISGAQPVDRFIAVVDEELKKANDRIAKGDVTAANYYEKVIVGEGLKKL